MSRGPYPILLMLAMSLPGAARALGLGDIRIDSALNEPLSAQIDIVGATRDELIALTAKIANREVFQRYGADRPSFLSSATFRVGVDAQGRPVLNVRSAEAFTDPVVSFLVDLRWGNGELIREYSLLLDPSGFGSTRLAATPALSDRPAGMSDRPLHESAARPAPVPALGVDPRAAAMTSQSPASQSPTWAKPAEGAPLPEPAHDVLAGRHLVTQGETLRGIVRQAGAIAEPHAQRMMIAVFRANPHAFEGNINLLHVGAVLSLPLGSAVDAISPADARREVSDQTTAWRLDGRPAAARHLASAPGPAGVPHAAADTHVNPGVNSGEGASATDALQGRVQSLELAMNDLHKQLADDSATIEGLKHNTATASASIAASTRAPTPASTSTPASASASIPVPVPVPASTPAPASVDVEVMHATPRPAPILAAVATPNSEPSLWGWSALIAGGMALLVAGFAYRRRRAQKAGQRYGFLPDEADRNDAPVVVSGAMLPPAREIQSAPGTPGAETAAYEHAAVRTEDVGAPAAQSPLEPVPNDQTTQELAIDAEALEQSYLDALSTDSLGIDTADTARNATADLRPADEPFADNPFTNDPFAHDPFARDTAVHDPSGNDTTDLETVAVDVLEFDPTLGQEELNTAIIDLKAVDSAAHHTSLDYDLLDLDATAEHVQAQHVQMPSQLTDPAVVAERRMNIVDVLKTAIDRDPNRRDLRMKLLETHYNAAAANRDAFLDIVKKLSRERETLTADDWKAVIKMGREIAPEDILFADPNGGDLANCA